MPSFRDGETLGKSNENHDLIAQNRYYEQRNLMRGRKMNAEEKALAEQKRRIRALTKRQFPHEQPCVECGEGKAERHHPKIIERPLDIVWLCFDCHQREHGHGKLTQTERERGWEIARGLRK